MKEQLKQSQSQPKPLGFTRKFNTTKPYISSLTGPPVDIWWVAFKKNLISIFPSSKSDCVSLLRGFGQTKPGLQISTDFSGQGRLPDGMMNDPLRRTEMKSLCLIDWTFQHSEWLIARQCNGSLASVYWTFWTHYSPNELMWRRNTVCFRIDNYHIVFFQTAKQDETYCTHPSTAALGRTIVHTENTDVLALTIQTHLKQKTTRKINSVSSKTMSVNFQTLSFLR